MLCKATEKHKLLTKEVQSLAQHWCNSVQHTEILFEQVFQKIAIRAAANMPVHLIISDNFGLFLIAQLAGGFGTMDDVIISRS